MLEPRTYSLVNYREAESVADEYNRLAQRAEALHAVMPAAAITKNFRDDDEHPFVGLIAFYDSDWVFIHRCTAELLSPTVALTAGHCTNNPALPNGAEIPFDGEIIAVCIPASSLRVVYGF